MPVPLPASVQRIIEAICAEDLETTLAQFDSDGSFQDPTGHWRGPEELRQFFTVAFAAVENITWKIGRTVVEENRVVFEWHFGYRVVLGPAAGKSADWDGITIMELRNGKIWRYRDYWNSQEPLGQLGFKSWEEVGGGILP
jgi:ketosteroid isomerase-like protein